MIEFSIGPALLAGLVGALVMTAMMKMAAAAGMTEMPGMPLIQGAMFTDDESTAKLIGVVTHVIVMGTVVFGLVYAGLFVAFDSTSWLLGLVIGLVHGVVAGLAFVGMGAMHPRMQPPAAMARPAPVTRGPDGLRIAAPGLFGRNYGGMTPMGLLVGHAVYGVVVALVYGALS